MTLKQRINIEYRIVRRAIRDALKRGYSLSVSGDRGYDMEEMLIGSKDLSKVFARCVDYDDCHLFLHAPDQEPTVDDQVNAEGWVHFVFGNDGYDVISDYTTNLEDLLTGAHELSIKLERQHVN